MGNCGLLRFLCLHRCSGGTDVVEEVLLLLVAVLASPCWLMCAPLSAQLTRHLSKQSAILPHHAVESAKENCPPHSNSANRPYAAAFSKPDKAQPPATLPSHPPPVVARPRRSRGPVVAQAAPIKQAQAPVLVPLFDSPAKQMR